MTKTRRLKLPLDRHLQWFEGAFNTATCSKSASLFDVDGGLNLARDRQTFVEEPPDPDIAASAERYLTTATVATIQDLVLAPTVAG